MNGWNVLMVLKKVCASPMSGILGLRRVESLVLKWKSQVKLCLLSDMMENEEDRARALLLMS